MKEIYETKYKSHRSNGDLGWGGNDRIALIPEQFDYELKYF